MQEITEGLDNRQFVMNLLCVIKEVALKAANNHFIFVQLKDTAHDKSFKFRTEIVSKSERPQFHRSNFTFEGVEAEQENALTLKFGLFVTKLTHDSAQLSQQQLIEQSTAAGSATLKFNFNVLSQLQEKGFFEHSLPFMQEKKEIGRIYFAVKATDKRLDYLIKSEDTRLQRLFYNPFEEDRQSVENNISKLEALSQSKLKEYEEVRTRLSTIRGVQQKVHLDETFLSKKVAQLETENHNIHQQLMGKVDIESIRTQFELLKDTGKGLSLLSEKLQYLKGRIEIEKHLEADLKQREQNLAPLMKNRVEKARRHEEIAKEVKKQRFQMHRGKPLLKMYNQLVQQIISNELVIRSLKERSQKAQFTAKQALLIMEQAKFDAELAKYKHEQSDQTVDEKRLYELMEHIQSAAKMSEQQPSQYPYAYEVKLQALKQQIASLDSKIKDL